MDSQFFSDRYISNLEIMEKESKKSQVSSYVRLLFSWIRTLKEKYVFDIIWFILCILQSNYILKALYQSNNLHEISEKLKMAKEKRCV